MTTATKKKRATGTPLCLSDLRRALGIVSQAVPAKGPKPVLQNVSLRDGLITGSDLELQVQTSLDYHADPLLLPAARLSAILNSCSGDDVTLAPDGTNCTVTAGRGSWRLPVEDAAEFPLWEPSDARPVCRLPADQFCRAVKNVVYATDNESSRYALGAVLLEVKDGTVYFVATDGRRLSVYECEIDQAVDDTSVLIPARAIQAMARAALGEDSVQIEATDTEVVAECGSTTVTARLMQGKFPRWRDTVPERDTTRTLVAGADLLAATRAAAICTSESSLGVTFVITPDGIHLTGKSSEAGESSVTCPVVEFGQACTVKLDPRFVADFLRNLGEDSAPVEVDAVDSVSSVIIRCDDATGVIMPLAQDG
jgi:DNA polymerase-3 subunit beta